MIAITATEVVYTDGPSKREARQVVDFVTRAGMGNGKVREARTAIMSVALDTIKRGKIPVGKCRRAPLFSPH